MEARFFHQDHILVQQEALALGLNRLEAYSVRQALALGLNRLEAYSILLAKVKMRLLDNYLAPLRVVHFRLVLLVLAKLQPEGLK